MAAFTTIIAVIYYLLIAYVAIILICNLIKARKWDMEILYLIVLVPFLLRLFRLK